MALCPVMYFKRKGFLQVSCYKNPIFSHLSPHKFIMLWSLLCVSIEIVNTTFELSYGVEVNNISCDVTVIFSTSTVCLFSCWEHISGIPIFDLLPP
ncbi:hypothetical protein AB205_0197330 [Aquarana catesbeiana]|uniref:Uncharacterized protein n=1 Tax=Aquarana catesbeiana TaxID=8400 RepID=A0A2G9SLL8_AQUCT|nr:hypothetical protein AB205_0197330 [Aquarana catesbeiana]